MTRAHNMGPGSAHGSAGPATPISNPATPVGVAPARASAQCAGVIKGVTEAERGQIVAAGDLGDLDVKLKQRLWMQMARGSTLPPDVVARWSAAKGDRHGLKQLSILKDWARDPNGFGQAQISEAVSVSKETQSDAQWE